MNCRGEKNASSALESSIIKSAEITYNGRLTVERQCEFITAGGITGEEVLVRFRSSHTCLMGRGKWANGGNLEQ